MLKAVDRMCIAMMARWNVLKNEERGGVGIVEIVVLCGIVVVLAIVFRDAISGLITDVMEEVRTNAIKKVTEEPTS